MESPKPPSPSRFSAFLPLGFTFIILGVTMEGMIAFIGVGAAFLFLHYNQQQKANK